MKRGVLPDDPLDLQVFFEAERLSPDPNLRSQLESRLLNLIPNQTRVVLGERIEFLGYEVRRVSPESVQIDIFFRSLMPIYEDYSVWVHAVPQQADSLLERTKSRAISRWIASCRPPLRGRRERSGGTATMWFCRQTRTISALGSGARRMAAGCGARILPTHTPLNWAGSI